MKGQFILVSAILLILIPSFGIFPHKLYAQTITGVSPNPACVGDILTISGSELDEVIEGKIGNTKVPLVANSLSSTGFQIVIPAGLGFVSNSPTDFVIEARIQNVNNPSFADPVRISPEISLSVSFGPGQTANICEGNSVDITIDPDPSDPETGDFAYTYTWTPEDNLSSTDQAIVTAMPTSTTSYTVEVEAGAGCPYTETIEIDVRRAPSLDDVVIISDPCEEGEGEIEIVASGNAALEYRLVPGNSTFSNNPVFSNLTARTYGVQIGYVDMPRCQQTYEDYFTLSGGSGGSLSASILSPLETDSFCVGDPLMLIAENDPAVSTYTWTLSADGQADTLGGLGPISARFTTSGEKEISLTVSDGNCTVSESVTIQIDGLDTNIGINKDQSRICQGEQVIFSTETLEGEAMYTWDFGDTATPNMGTGIGPDTVMFSDAGMQVIMLTIDQGGCPAIVLDTIVVDTLPSITVLPSIPTRVLSGDTVELMLQTPVESVSINWQLTLGAGLDSISALTGEDSLIRQAFTLNSEADAQVKFLIMALAENGCMETLEFSFIVSQEVLPTNFSAPEVFTPNGDGYNETWSVVLPPDLIASEHVLVIFNRSGGLIFEEDPSVTWDGRNFRNGQPAPAGPYWYLVYHKERRGETLFSGAVTLIR